MMDEFKNLKGKILTCTNQLRYETRTEKPAGSPNNEMIPLEERVLQQLWISDLGLEEWKDVLYVKKQENDITK